MQIFVDCKQKELLLKPKFLSSEIILIPKQTKIKIINDQIVFPDFVDFNLTFENFVIATDPNDEGEFLCYALLKKLGADIKSSKRIRIYQFNDTGIENAFNNPVQVDMEIIEKMKTLKILNYESGLVISSFLFNKISKTYEKKLLMNITQYHSLGNLGKTKMSVTGYFFKWNIPFSLVNNTYSFEELTTLSFTLSKSTEEKVFLPEKPDFETLYSLYLRGFLELPTYKKIQKSIETLTAKEKSLYKSIYHCKPWQLLHQNVVIFQSAYDGDLQCASSEIKVNSLRSSLVENEDIEYKHLEYRGFINKNDIFFTNDLQHYSNGEFSFDRFSYRPQYCLSIIGEIVLKVLRDNGIDDDWKSLSLKIQNENIKKFEIPFSEDAKCIVGKYGLVLKTASNEFVKIPAKTTLEQLMSKSVNIDIPRGYYEGKAVFFKTGPYGSYLQIDGFNISLKTNRKNLRWEEIEKIIKNSKYK